MSKKKNHAPAIRVKKRLAAVKRFRWTFSDGTVVTSGGNVTGDSELAEELRYNFHVAQNIAGGVVNVGVVPQPGGDLPLDVDSDWLLDLYLKQKSGWFRVALQSDYLPDDAKAPANVRALLKSRAGFIFDPKAVY